MRFIFPIILLFILSSCEKKEYVAVSGQFVNGDSLIQIYTSDSIYTFALDENRYFQGKILLGEGGEYASLSPYRMDIFLSPGEDLEIYTDVSNMDITTSFRGSLGSINTYIFENQDISLTIDQYRLSEGDFLKLMDSIMQVNSRLLEAKNFMAQFTELEKLRLGYSVGEKVLLYPVFHLRDTTYTPSFDIPRFVSHLPLYRKELALSLSYRRFVLNYAYYSGGQNYNPQALDFAENTTTFILGNFQNEKIRDFLLSEILVRYIWENNGLEKVGPLLKAYRENAISVNRREMIESLVMKWEKLLPGNPSPEFVVEDLVGKEYTNLDFRGKYLYISVWTTWCEPCKRELLYLRDIMDSFSGRNITFLNISLDNTKDKQKWRDMVQEKKFGNTNAIITDNRFAHDYMIISIPRFILIDPDGNLVTSNAVRPTEGLYAFLTSFDI